MCGIVGVAGKMDEDHHKVFRDMLYMDVVRGPDSTGVFHIDATNKNHKGLNYDIVKVVGHPMNLWDLDADQSVSYLFDYSGLVCFHSRLLLGHNRATTSGKTTVENAHPFEFEDIIGVHNGTLTNTHTYETKGKFDVDSKALYNYMSIEGIDNTWKNLWGAAALVFFNKETNTLNLVRNKERTLYQLYDEKNQVLYWASEPWMINAAIGRSKIPHPTKSVKNSAGVVEQKNILPSILQPDRLYEYNLVGDAVTFKGDRELEKKYTAYTTNTSGNMGYGMAYNKRPSPYMDKKDEDIVNYGWTKDYKKGDATFRDRVVRLRYGFIDASKPTSVKYSIVGELLGEHNRVVVLPNTFGEYVKLRDLLNKETYIDVTVKSKPRILHDQEGHALHQKGLEVLGYSLQAVDFENAPVKKDSGWVERETHNGVTVLYPKAKPDVEPEELVKKKLLLDHNGQVITTAEFKERLSASGQACVNCGDVFNFDSPEEVTWKEKYTPWCTSCVEKNDSRFLEA